jgi:hypothetical protein
MGTVTVLEGIVRQNAARVVVRGQRWLRFNGEAEEAAAALAGLVLRVVAAGEDASPAVAAGAIGQSGAWPEELLAADALDASAVEDPVEGGAPLDPGFVEADVVALEQQVGRVEHGVAAVVRRCDLPIEDERSSCAAGEGLEFAGDIGMVTGEVPGAPVHDAGAVGGGVCQHLPAAVPRLEGPLTLGGQ